MRIRIAVAQTNIHWWSQAKNIAMAERYIKTASRKKCDVIIFPEYLASGTGRKTDEVYVENHLAVRKFISLAKQYRIDIVPGSFLEREGQKKYNVAYYIDRDGRILDRYKKIKLWASEKRTFYPGRNAKVFKTRYGKVGLMICWDMAFPEVSRAMMKKGAEVIFCPTFWSKEDAGVGLKYNRKADVEFINACAVTRAFENELIFVVCNAAGQVKTRKGVLHLLGRSQITVPFIGPLKRFDHSRPGMFIQDVNTDILERAEKAYSVKKDLKL